MAQRTEVLEHPRRLEIELAAMAQKKTTTGATPESTRLATAAEAARTVAPAAQKDLLPAGGQEALEALVTPAAARARVPAVQPTGGQEALATAVAARTAAPAAQPAGGQEALEALGAPTKKCRRSGSSGKYQVGARSSTQTQWQKVAAGLLEELQDAQVKGRAAEAKAEALEKQWKAEVATLDQVCAENEQLTNRLLGAWGLVRQSQDLVRETLGVGSGPCPPEPGSVGR